MRSLRGVQARKDAAGFTAFTVTADQNSQWEEKLHCAISCRAYAEKCSSPEECGTNSWNDAGNAQLKKS